MSAEILFVDDDLDVLAGFQRSLRKEFKIDTATGGGLALGMLRHRPPYAVVVVDMQMPCMNGVEFLMELEKVSPDTVRIMLTGNADQKTARDAVNHGHIFRFLSKPCPQEDLILALRAAMRQFQLVTAERDVLEQTLNGSARVLSDILAMHDPHAFGRSQRLQEYMRAFAKHLNLKQTWDLELAAMLSQIGCVTVPQTVLAKWRQGQALVGAENDMVLRVPQIGHDLLSRIPRLEPVAAVVLYQNKNFDGSGFPSDQVAGDKIPIGARILRVLQDLAAAESSDASKARTFHNMTKYPDRYDPMVLEAVAAVFDVCLDTTDVVAPVSRAVGIRDLRVGSVLTAAVRTRDGMMLVAEGTRISPMLLEKLRNFAELGELEEPMLVAE